MFERAEGADRIKRDERELLGERLVRVGLGSRSGLGLGLGLGSGLGSGSGSGSGSGMGFGVSSFERAPG